MTKKLQVRLGHSDRQDPRSAVSELAAQLRQQDTSLVIFFCSSRYDLKLLGEELASEFSCPVIGCTTAGEISSNHGFQQGTIVGASLASANLKAHPYLIRDVNRFDFREARQLADMIRDDLQVESLASSSLFAFLLIDGLSMAEEHTTASLYSALEEIPLIGGSAGDDLEFSRTHIFHGGEFLTNCAIVTVFETDLPFHIFKTHHLVATDDKLVITGTIPNKRCVTEFNGLPAVEEYARVIGVEPEQLTPAVFSRHPLLLKIGGAYYVRSIFQANDDGFLSLFCDIDKGLVVTVARSGDLEDNIRSTLRDIEGKLNKPRFILACDCILRKLELEEKELTPVISNLFSDCNFLGFSTYGEQFNSIHINQTMTGFVIGE